AVKISDQKPEELDVSIAPVISSLDDITESDIVLCFAFLNDLLGNDKLTDLYKKDPLSTDSLIGQFQQFWSLSEDKRHSELFHAYNRYANAIKFSDTDNREIFEHVYSELLSSIPEDAAEIHLKALVQTFNKFIIFYLDQAKKHIVDKPALTKTFRSIQDKRASFLAAKSSKILDREDYFFDQLHINNLFHVLTASLDIILPKASPILLDFPPRKEGLETIKADYQFHNLAEGASEIEKFKEYAGQHRKELPKIIGDLEELFLCKNFSDLRKANIFKQKSIADDELLIQEIKYLNNFLRDFFIAQLPLDRETQAKVNKSIAEIDRIRNQIELPDQEKTDEIKKILESLKASLQETPQEEVSKIIYLIQHLDNKEVLLTRMKAEIKEISRNITEECEVISDLQDRTKRCHKYPDHDFTDIEAATSVELSKSMPFTASSKSPEIERYETLRAEQQKALADFQKAETNLTTIKSRIEEARHTLSELFRLINDLCHQQINITYNELSEEERKVIRNKTIDGLWSKIRNYLFHPDLNDAANNEFKTRLAHFNDLKGQLDSYIKKTDVNNLDRKGQIGFDIKQLQETKQHDGNDQKIAALKVEREVLGLNDKLAMLNQLLRNIDEDFGDLGEAILSRVSDIQTYAKKNEKIASLERQSQLLQHKAEESIAREMELIQRIAELEAIQQAVDIHKTPSKTPISSSPQKTYGTGRTPLKSSDERAATSRDFTEAARSLVNQVLYQIKYRIPDEKTKNLLIGEISTKLQKQPQQNIDEIIEIFQKSIPNFMSKQPSHNRENEENARRCIQDFFTQQQTLLEGSEPHDKKVGSTDQSCQTETLYLAKAEAPLPKGIKPLQRMRSQAKSEILTYIRTQPEAEQLKYCHFVARQIFLRVKDSVRFKSSIMNQYKKCFKEEWDSLKKDNFHLNRSEKNIETDLTKHVSTTGQLFVNDCKSESIARLYYDFFQEISSSGLSTPRSNTLSRTSSHTSLSSGGSLGSRRNLSSEFRTSASSSQGDKKLLSDEHQTGHVGRVITAREWQPAAEKDVSRSGGGNIIVNCIV
ncbi:hypothetical protein OAP83_02395, partial [Rickettsiales bacterium]|nr:hypothetical protein [Rickettsiales bacterium]